ncbi:rhodanese-like domain-containing protein [Ideonella oryzae]|uniref:Rhodanese-like domain-containing protein n=1 Tax=Ideonella oryzae TaxID=2937441 RepID=A0ABT1BND9_9BURK|nr:rhodanese-like domain-containing protein [Ideonella oryzae]MCO5977638.1 rhodanese-like domain-containing protein [Ideonella oryzae]
MSSPDPLLIDVRSPGEYAGGYLDGAVNLPLDQLQAGIARVAPDLSQPIVLYCASGGRSGMGCMLLQQMGYRQVSNGGGIGMLAMSSQRPVRRL